MTIIEERRKGRPSRNGPPAPPDEPGPVPLGELLDRHQALRPVVIDGLLRAGETMNVISQSKVGKSWAVLDLVLAVATGGRWLGSFPTVQGSVLLLDNELHPETLADRVRKVAAERGIDLADVREWVQVKTLRGKPRNVAEFVRLLEGWGIKAGDCRLIVIDALYRAMPPGVAENSNDGMKDVYNWLDELAETFRAAVAIVHHGSKGDQSQKAVTDVGAGAGAQSRAADSHVVFRPHEDDSATVMDAAVRSFPPIPSRCFRWSFPVWEPADDLNPELLSSPNQRKREQQAEAKDRKYGTDLLTLLDDLDPNKEGAGRTKLRKALGWNLDKFNRVVAGLVREGFLTDCEVGDSEGVRRRTRSEG